MNGLFCRIPLSVEICLTSDKQVFFAFDDLKTRNSHDHKENNDKEGSSLDGHHLAFGVSRRRNCVGLRLSLTF